MPTMITRGAASARAFGLFKAVSGAVTDAYFKYVTMLLPGNGTNGAQNNTFLDSSTNNFTITRNGNTTQGTFSPYGSNWSNYFNGSSYITVASNAVLAPGTGDFTIECWVNFQSLPATNAIAPICQNDADLTSTSSIWWLGLFNNAGTNQLALGQHATSNRGTVNWTPTVGVWYHIVAERQSGTVLMFIDGVQQTVSTSTALNGANFGQEGFMIGGISTPYYLTGYISNLRYTVGAAVYTSSFTPSTTPLTTTSQGASASQVELLTCQSNRFIDNSSNAFAITVNSAPTVQRFSPFSPSAAYSTATVGGSMYLDGTGDYLSVPDNAALEGFTGNFTIEMWCYFKTSNAPVVITKGADVSTTYAPYLIYGSGSDIYLAGSNDGSSWAVVTVPIISGVKIGQWYHIAVTRSGSTYYTFSNGTLVSTGTWSGTLMTNSADVRFGISSAGTKPMDGYMTDARIVNGTAVYTSSFTPPTAPLTAISGTQLLLSTTNAGIIDNAMMNDLETVGNAQISTTQSKFGGSSIAFDGVGDYLKSNAATSDLCTFGTGDFTIEMWLYLTNVSVAQVIFDTRPAATNGVYPDIYFNNSGSTLNWYISSADRITSSAVSINTWYHVAVCRSGSSTKMFINGTQAGSTYTDTNNYLCAAQRPIIGVNATDSSSSPFYGYIDDLRITKGYARYTASFTAPTAAFPTS